MAELNRIAERGLAGDFRRDEPMHRHTTWRAGGTADRAYFPRDLEDVAKFIQTIPRDEPVYVVGLGSNLLVRDGGLRGTVIFMHGALKQLRLDVSDPRHLSHVVYAEAGVASPKAARFAATHGLDKAEFLAGIPGTLGGALAMNAGCYGSETWEVVEAVLMLGRDGRLIRRAKDEFDIGYRHVAPVAAVREEWFVAAWLRLPFGDGEAARRRIKELLTRRIATQPLEQPNAGSVFRNPAGDHAARLIESCGLKGYVIGGATVSPKHANFIVNTDAASAADIESLITHVQETVRERCGVLLDREVRIIGEYKNA